MNKLIWLVAVVAAVGFVSLAVATQPAPEVQEPEATIVPAEQEAPQQAPALADPLGEIPLKTEAGCTPLCSTLHGTACSGAQHTKRCYHVCGEPDICICTNGAWNCQ